MDDLISKTDVVKIVKSVLSPASSLTNVARARRQMLNQIYELESKPEPHWIPVTELPKYDFMPYYATCRSKVDDRENWVIEGMYTKYSGWECPPMVRDGRAEIIAWMPKELPEPYKGVTE